MSNNKKTGNPQTQTQKQKTDKDASPTNSSQSSVADKIEKTIVKGTEKTSNALNQKESNSQQEKKLDTVSEHVNNKESDEALSSGKANQTIKKEDTGAVQNQVQKKAQQRKKANTNSSQNPSVSKSSEKASETSNNISKNTSFSSSQSKKQVEEIKTETSNSGKGIATVALLAGLGGLGLSSFQYFKPDYTVIDKKISVATNKADEKASSLTGKIDSLVKGFDSKTDMVSKELESLGTALKEQPTAKLIQQSVLESLTPTLEQKVSDSYIVFKTEADESTKTLIDVQVSTFTKNLNELSNNVSTLVDSGVANMNADDIKNAQVTIDDRVQNAFESLTTENVEKFSRLNSDIQEKTAVFETGVKKQFEAFEAQMLEVNTKLLRSKRDFVFLEVEYLISMAQRKSQIEHQPLTAIALLKEAKSKLSVFKLESVDTLTKKVETEIDTLSGVMSIDKQKIIKEINLAELSVNNLISKSTLDDVKVETPTGSFSERISKAFKNTVVEIPKDPSVIKITPESAEYARQNLKLNLNYLKYAVLTEDQILFDSNNNALLENLSVAFGENDALMELKAIQLRLKETKVIGVYPDLTQLSQSFTLLRQALNSAGE